jgi:hypothetical protein
MNFKFTAQKTSRKYVRSGKPGGLKGIKLKRISFYILSYGSFLYYVAVYFASGISSFLLIGVFCFSNCQSGHA